MLTVEECRAVADHPTQFQHAAAKPKADRHAINLMAKPLFAMGGVHRRATYQQVDEGELDASMVLRQVERAHKVLHPQVQLAAAEREIQEAILMDMKVLAVNALPQRCSTARSRYKRPTGVNPTILVHMHALERPDEVERLTSFEKELQLVLSRRPQAAHTTTAFDNLGHSRDEFLYLEGDLSFCVAGDVERADKSGVDDAEEQWWAFQLASRFAHSRLTGPRPDMCTIEILWLDKCDGGYRLLPNASEKIKYGSIIKGEDGSPIMVRRESMEARGLVTTWQEEVGLVYTLPTELCSQLDERLDELEAGGATRVDAGSDAELSDDEHDEDRATEQRATASALQQTLCSCNCSAGTELEWRFSGCAPHRLLWNVSFVYVAASRGAAWMGTYVTRI